MKTLTVISSISSFLAAVVWLRACYVAVSPLPPGQVDPQWDRAELIDVHKVTKKGVAWGATIRLQTKLNAIAAAFAAIAAAIQGYLSWPF